jgi:quercetin dioxygenase-like cupin family protein
MKSINFVLVMMSAMGLALGLTLTPALSAQEHLNTGKVLERTTLKAAPEWEAIAVERDLPAGAESGKHTQMGNEIVYIESGAVVLQVQGKPDKTVKAGEAFTTSAGEVHNVKNASSSEPTKAIAFYVAKKGAKMEDLSKPAK